MMEKSVPEISPDWEQKLRTLQDGEHWIKGLRQTNPFLLPGVLQTMFPYLDAASLLSCRQVSRLWNEVSTPLLRPKVKVTLQGPLTEEPDSGFLNIVKNKKHVNKKMPMPMDSLTYGFHHSGFSFKTSNLFTKLGPSLRSLTLQAHDVNADRTTTCKLISNMSLLLQRDCQNLESLELTHLHLLNFAEVKLTLDDDRFSFRHEKMKKLTLSFGALPCPNTHIGWEYFFGSLCFIRKIFPAFPSLVDLSIEYGVSEDMLTCLMIWLKMWLTQIHEITSFSLTSGPFAAESLTLLGELEFKSLKDLSLNLDIDSTLESLFTTFLQRVSPTLEKFRIRGTADKFNFEKRKSQYLEKFSMSFPPMPKLKYLEHCNFQGLRISSHSFLQNLPSLQSLIVKDRLPSIGDQMLSSNLTVYGSLFAPGNLSTVDIKPSLSVTSLVVDALFIPSFKSNSSISKIVTLFPNLEELELVVSLGLTNTNLPQVLQSLSEAKKLKTLRLRFLQCGELTLAPVANSFHSAFLNEIRNFLGLRELSLTLEDLPFGFGFNLPFVVLQAMVQSESLAILHLKGLQLGANSEEMEACRNLMDQTLINWNVSEPDNYFSTLNFSNF